MPDDGELVVVLVDEPDPDPVVVLVDPPALGEVAVVAVDAPAPSDGPGPRALDDLRDVDAPPTTEGVLHRDPDGIVRALDLAAVRTDVFGGDGPPPDVVPGAGRGDLYLDRLTGDLYRLD